MSYSGEGLPVEPGRGSNHWKLASITELSLWPKPSYSFRPVKSSHFL